MRPAQRDAIERALVHHELAGVVTFYSPPEQHGDARARRSTWQVRFAGSDDVHVLNTPAVVSVCAALAAAEHTHRVMT